jgi:hypothetical protein
VTDLLLARMRPEDISRRNVSGRTILHLAAMNRRDEAVPLLLARMNTKDVWTVSMEPKRQTALHMAAEANFPEIVEALLARGKAVHFTIRDETGQMALHLAAERGHIEVVRQLLDHMDLNDVVDCDNDSETALHKAAKGGQMRPSRRRQTATPELSGRRGRHRCQRRGQDGPRLGLSIQAPPCRSLIEERLRGGAA